MTREEAIDIFEHNWTRLENHDYTEDELNEALNIAMQTLGAIDQIQWERDTAIAQLKDLGYSLGEKPKTGHWIKINVNYYNRYQCNQCDRLVEEKTDFCPHCGADMRGEE